MFRKRHVSQYKVVTLKSLLRFFCSKKLKYICIFTHITISLQGKREKMGMNDVRIIAMRQTVYDDLMERFENPIEHACDVTIGQEWISVGGRMPEDFCPSAWEVMRPFVESLARGEGNFFDGWMQNPMSAMISCNDGFRPVSFYLEVISNS
jgi:uncharacterized repeat protein (TIGR04076 family)